MNEHLVVSQFPEGTPPISGDFVQRNRTMALLSHASIIIEAGEQSGTMHQGWETHRLGRLLLLPQELLDGICGGSWATMHWLSRSIDSRFETLTEVNIRIERARATLAEMQETTWGVELREISGERYVALPARTPVRPAFTMDGRPYLKLSNE